MPPPSFLYQHMKEIERQLQGSEERVSDLEVDNMFDRLIKFMCEKIH